MQICILSLDTFHSQHDFVSSLFMYEFYFYQSFPFYVKRFEVARKLYYIKIFIIIIIICSCVSLVCRDGMRQSNVVTKVFDVEFATPNTCPLEDDGLNFVSEVRASHVSILVHFSLAQCPYENIYIGCLSDISDNFQDLYS